MSKPIAVFDIDGTIFRSSLLIEVTNALIKAGIFPPGVAELYQREYDAWLRREGSYDGYLYKLIAAFMTHIKGVKVTDLESAAETVIQNTARHTYRYTRDLIKQLQPSHFLVAISASPTELVSLFSKHYGFSDYRATRYPSINGRYTGEQVLALHNKDQLVLELVKQHNLTLDGSIGVGDSESDAAILKLVTKPIAFNPNSVLFQQAMENQWQVVVERKDVIYHYNHGR